MDAEFEREITQAVAAALGRINMKHPDLRGVTKPIVVYGSDHFGTETMLTLTTGPNAASMP